MFVSFSSAKAGEPAGPRTATEASSPTNDDVESTDDDATAQATARRAKQHFERGVQRYEEGDFKAALLEFELAYEALPHAAVLYNIGVTQVEVQDFAGAYVSLQRYLVESNQASISEERRSRVEHQMEVLETKVGHVDIRTEPHGSEVWINGVLVGTTPAAVALNTGFAAIEVSHDGHETRRERVMVLAGKTFELIGSLAPTTTVTTTTAAPTKDSDRSAALQRRLRATWVFTGVSAAAIVGGTAAGLIALTADSSLNDELNELVDDPVEAEQRQQDLRDRIDASALAADILIGVAVVTGVTAIGLGVSVVVQRKQNRSSSGAAWLDIEPRLGGIAIHF